MAKAGQSEIRELEQELKKGLQTLREKQLEQEKWDATLSQREEAFAHRDVAYASLEMEHKSLRAMCERLKHGDKLAEELKTFIAREGKTIAETLGELMLVRRLGGSRLRHLSLLASELQDLRQRISGQPVAGWRAPPQLSPGQQFGSPQFGSMGSDTEHYDRNPEQIF